MHFGKLYDHAFTIVGDKKHCHHVCVPSESLCVPAVSSSPFLALGKN